MQSDRNNFCGDVILDSVNMVFKDEDSISDQIYEKQIYIRIFIRKSIIWFFLLW